MIKKIRSSKAFTLIEMLIVVAIIGILVGVGVPALRNARADAQLRKQQTVLNNVATAKARFELDSTLAEITAFNVAAPAAKFTSIQEYLVVNGTMPADIGALVAGTGYVAADLAINNCATFLANGQQDTAAVAPSFGTNGMQ